MNQIFLAVFFNYFLFSLVVCANHQDHRIFHTIEEIEQFAQENCINKQCADVWLQPDPKVEEYQVIQITFKENDSDDESQNKHETGNHAKDGHASERITDNSATSANWINGLSSYPKSGSSGFDSSWLSGWSGSKTQSSNSADSNKGAGNIANGWGIGVISKTGSNNPGGLGYNQGIVNAGSGINWGIGLGINSLRTRTAYDLLKPLDNLRKFAKRSNNILDTTNDINLINFNQKSQDYKDFQKTISKRAVEEAPALVPLVTGLNQIGSAIDNSNAFFFNSAHSGLKGAAGDVRVGLDKLKPLLKDPNRTKKSFRLTK